MSKIKELLENDYCEFWDDEYWFGKYEDEQKELFFKINSSQEYILK